MMRSKRFQAVGSTYGLPLPFKRRREAVRASSSQPTPPRSRSGKQVCPCRQSAPFTLDNRACFTLAFPHSESGSSLA